MTKRPKSTKNYASPSGTVLHAGKSSKAGKSVAASVLTQRPAGPSKSAKVLQDTAERDSDALIRLARR